MPKIKNPYIITTFGADGAVSAAVILDTHPKAKIITTSTNRLNATLTELSKLSGSTIYICGIGAGEDFNKTQNTLSKLKKSNNTLIWFCGRGYMDNYKTDLQKSCKTHFKDSTCNAQLCADFFKTAETSHIAKIIEIATEFVNNSTELSENNRWWHDLIRATASRYFKYDDISAYIDCIKKLAGQREPTEKDQDEVDNWRKNGQRTQLIGNSPAIKKLRKQITLIGPVDAPVLILGESGSGKELAARLIHESSSRAKGEFIAVNCAVLSTSSDLAHDKLFGHISGAYTGAKKDSIGAFEAAEGGTLFLDEFAELPISAQTQLLRALEENEIVPLGTITPRPIDVRIIAATNGNLPQMIKDGNFRLDLYHRLNVLPLKVPSLIERTEDMKSISRSFIHQLGSSGHQLTISEKDWEAAERYNWPGNIRQFINLLRRSAYMQITLKEAINQEINEEPRTTETAGSQIYLPKTLKEAKTDSEIRKNYMQHVLHLASGSYLKAAHTLDISVNTLKRWL